MGQSRQNLKREVDFQELLWPSTSHTAEHRAAKRCPIAIVAVPVIGCKLVVGRTQR